MEAKADRYGVVHLVHLGLVQPPHMLPQAALIDGPDLFQEDHRILGQSDAAACDVDVGGQTGFAGLAGDGRSNDRRPCEEDFTACRAASLDSL